MRYPLATALLFCLLASLPGRAQDRPAVPAAFGRHHFLLSLGYGFPVAPFRDQSYSLRPPRSRKGFGPLDLSVEIPVSAAISIRASVQHLRQTADWTEGSTRYSYFGKTTGFGVMGCYHFSQLIPVPRLDVYSGLGFGAFSQTETLRSSDANSEVSGMGFDTRFFPAAIVGARYYFLGRLAVFAEAGYTALATADPDPEGTPG